MIQLGGVQKTTFCREEGIPLQKYKYCDRKGKCIAIFIESIRVRGRFDFPEELCDLSDNRAAKAQKFSPIAVAAPTHHLPRNYYMAKCLRFFYVMYCILITQI